MLRVNPWWGSGGKSYCIILNCHNGKNTDFRYIYQDHKSYVGLQQLTSLGRDQKLWVNIYIIITECSSELIPFIRDGTECNIWTLSIPNIDHPPFDVSNVSKVSAFIVFYIWYCFYDIRWWVVYQTIHIKHINHRCKLGLCIFKMKYRFIAHPRWLNIAPL